jgi:DNA-binding transcriptional LysR family regulator
LCVTAAAVSYQIKLLEQELGTTLFLRTPKGLRLTRDGRALHSICNSALGQIAEGIEALKSDASERRIRIETLPGFSAEVLMPGQAEFKRQNPKVTLEVYHSVAPPAFSEGLDFAIYFGRGSWPTLRSDLLFNSALTPACSPKLVKSARLKTAADLQSVPILIEDNEFHELWIDWFRANGVAGWESLRYINCNDIHAMLSLAVSGEGALLEPEFLIRKLLASKQLVTPFSLSLRDYGYYLLYPESTLKQSYCRAFRDWLVQYVRAQSF